MSVPIAKTYRPTKAEFEDPLLYIQSIRAEAQLYGIVKIIPPDDFRPPSNIDEKKLTFSTRKQRIDLLQHRDLDAVKVEFLTKLTSFWQREHRARNRPPESPRYWNVNEASGAAAAAAAAADTSATTTPQRSKHGKRRTEAALLMDPRRRPRDKFPEPVASAAEAASSSAAQPAAAGHTPSSVDKTAFNSSSMVHELRMAASAYASGGRSRLSSAASTDGPKSSASAAHHASDVSAVSDDFIIDGVRVSDGMVVAPTLRSVAESKGYNPASGLAEVDLFVLFELATRRWNGFLHLSKKQWLDVLRQLMLTERITDKQHLFQANDEPRMLQNDEEAAKASAKKGKKPAHDLPAQILTQNAADELCAVYRSHLLPYEQYVAEHLQQSRVTAAKPPVDLSKPTSMELDDENSSAMNDEPKLAAAAAASSSSAAAASSPCIASSASHSSGVELSMPAPTFSMSDIRHWPHVRAMKAHLRAQLTEHSAAPRPAAASGSGSRSSRMGGSSNQFKVNGTDPSICAVCKSDTLAPMCQCHHCLSSFHFGCLTPPLSSSPLLPWYCPDCASSFSFGFTQGDEYDLLSYKSVAASFRHCWFASRQSPYTDTRCPHHAMFLQRDSSLPHGDCICRIPPEEIVRSYWHVVESGSHETPITVKYGSDIDTAASAGGAADGCSAFPSTGQYSRNGWNLNNLPAQQRSLLRHLRNISGITVPWLYVGMMFSSFCWHVEDHYAYSINYLHQGAIKQWYGVPSHAATAFEAQLRRTLPHLFSRQPDLMSHMVTMLSPSTLQAAGVPVYQIQQLPGEFVLTFPQAYHGGFNHGTNVAEAVNFAPADWLAFGIRSGERYRAFQRTPVFSTEQLIIQLAADPLLDSYTACWLDRCVQHVAAEELVMREHLRAAGLTRATRWTNQLHFRLFGAHPTKHDSEDASATAAAFKHLRGKAKHRTQSRTVSVTNQCVACKHAVYISAVSCGCEASRGQIACLRHAAYLCGCPANEQTLLMRLDCDQLNRLVARVQRTVSRLSASHAFTKLDHKRGEPVETVAEIQRENGENMQDTEIPWFCIESDDAASVELLPSFAQLKIARKKTGGGADVQETINAEFAPQRTEALHKSYQFLQSIQQSHDDLVHSSHLLQGAEASAASSASAQVAASFLHPTLEHIGGSLYPVQVVVTPMQKELIVAPPVQEVRNKIEGECVQWMKKIKPFVVAAFQLEREYNRKKRQEKRSRGEETDTSDDESDDSDDGASDENDQIAVESLLLSLEAERSEEDEDRIDRELRKLIKHKIFEEPPVKRTTQGSQRAKAAIVRSPPPAKLSPPTLQSMIEEGRSLIWSTTYAREVNLLFYKLMQWQDTVTRIDRLATAADPEEAMLDEDGEEQKASDTRVIVPTDAKKETLEEARRLIDAVLSIPFDLDSASTSSSSSAAAAAAVSSARNGCSQLQRGVAALKRIVVAAETVESSIRRALESDNWAALTLEQRNVHPRLLTFDEQCELQERANGLPLSFPDIGKLAAHISRSSVLLRRAGAVLGVRPPPVAFTVDAALQFSPSHRPWQAGSKAAVAAQLTAESEQNASGRSDAQAYTEGNQIQAEQLLAKLIALPLKHEYLSRLSTGLSSMHDFENRVHRVLYFCPGHSLAKDRDSFPLEELDKADRQREHAEKKACVSYATLVGLWTASQSHGSQSAALVKRLEKLHTAVEVWRSSMTQILQGVVQSFRLLMDPAPSEVVRAQTSLIRAEAAKRHNNWNPLFAFVDEPSLNALLNTCRLNGVFGTPEFTAYRRIRDLAPFFLRVHTTFMATLRSHATLFDFSTFQPAAWLEQLDRVFHPAHPLRPEWKKENWQQVLGVDKPSPLLPYAGGALLHIQSEVPHAAIEQVQKNKLSKLHPVTIDEEDEKLENDGAHSAAATSASASVAKRASASELASPEKRRKVEPASASAAIATAATSVADSESSDFELPAPSTSAAASSSSLLAPAKSTSNIKSLTKLLENVCNSGSALTVQDVATLYSTSQACVEQLRAEMPAAGGSTSVAAAQLAATTRSLLEPVLALLETQVTQLGSLLSLLGRLQQHLNHLQQLHDAILPVTISTGALQFAQQRSAAYLQSASAPVNPPPSAPSLCCFYPSPRVCPFYTLDELDHVRTLDKFVHGHFSLTLQHHKTLQRMWAKVQQYSQAAKRLLGSPCITEQEALELNHAVYTEAFSERQRKYSALLGKRSHKLFVEQQMVSSGRFGLHLSPQMAAFAISPLLHAVDGTLRFWQGVYQSILEESEFDFNVPLHVLLISGEANEPRLGGHHHTVGVHLQQNADRIALENVFQHLHGWCGRAEQCLKSLRGARAWCARNPLRLGRAGDAPATPLEPLLTQAHDFAVAVTTEHSKYISPLQRKLQQGLWSLRVYLSLMQHRSLAELRDLTTSPFFFRATAAQEEAKTGRASFIHDKVSYLPPMPVGVSTCTPAMCETVHRSMLAVPANEFELCSALDVLQQCISAGHMWTDQAQQMLAKIISYQSKMPRAADFDRLIQPPPSASRQHTAKERGELRQQASQLLHTVGISPVTLDDLQLFAGSACQCLSVAHCMDLRAVKERLFDCLSFQRLVHERFPTTLQAASAAASVHAAPPSVFPLLMDAHGNALQPFVQPQFPAVVAAPLVHPLRSDDLARLIFRGQSSGLSTPELRHLLDLELLNAEWIQRTNKLFDQRHPNLSLARHLRSMHVPITTEQDMAEVKRHMTDKEQPKPDSNGLYCICKENYDRTMIKCSTCGESYHAACVGVSVQHANRVRNSYCCPKCSEKSNAPYPYGDILYRAARPTLAACYAHLSWLDTQLREHHAESRFECDHAEALRKVLARIEEFKTFVQPWLLHMIEANERKTALAAKDTTQTPQAHSEAASSSDAAAAAAAAPADTATPMEDVPASATAPVAAGAADSLPIEPAALPADTSASIPAAPAASAVSAAVSSFGPPLDSATRSLIKGCIRQGKKMGINFPELGMLKRRYDQARAEAKRGQQEVAAAAASSSAAAPSSSAAAAASSSRSAQPSPEREVVMIDD